MTLEDVDPPGGAVREVRKPGLRMRRPGLVCASIIPCPDPLGKPLAICLRRCDPGGHCGVCGTDGSICQPRKVRRKETSPILGVLCCQFLSYPPTTPNDMSHGTYDCDLNHDSSSLLSCPYFIIPHTHYLLGFNNW